MEMRVSIAGMETTPAYGYALNTCTCPVFDGHRLHRWPCPLAGEITQAGPSLL